ncbi:MAG: Phosphomannomutase [Hyphomicrobiales bacterium]|nr:Phosphomannomutase [Hyphomicrobiales bacterium]
MLNRAPAQMSSPELSLIHPDAIRAYDIRGRAGQHLTPASFEALGLSYATLARQRGRSRIGVARDGRLSSPALEAGLVAGLVRGGLHVELLGLGPTPMLGFAVRQHSLDGGVMVTASHNPADENGLKVLLGCERIHGEALKALVALPGSPAPGGRARPAHIFDAYVDALAEGGRGLGEMSVAWDCGNGATGPAVERLTRLLPGRHVLLNTSVDGGFPSHHPDPALAENLRDLQAAVRAHSCDVGFAFDGDGDRIGVVDASGDILWADQLLLFLARDLLKRRPAAAIVADVKSSGALFSGVARAGGRPVMSPSGYVLVREAMRREGALLGGELSGHLFFCDEWDGTDDALYAAVRTLRALAGYGAPLSAFRRSLPASVATPELRIACADAAGVVRAAAERLGRRGEAFDPAMGVRVDTPDGWWLLRASGTERKITCRCEAADETGLARLKGALSAHLEASGLSVDLGSPSSESASR